MEKNLFLGRFWNGDKGLRMDLGMNSTPTTAGRNKKDKHIWTPIEDASLVKALNELCVGGYWKVDNEVRSRYLGQLEKAMEQKLPGCGLKAVPHIESRVKTLKKQTLAISDMLTNSSGFAWNDEEKWWYARNKSLMIGLRAKIVDEVQKIQGLSDMDVIDVAAAIVNDDAKIDLLFTLPDNLKIQWVKKLLHQY
ncbi:unnamed protein product [Prunus armeniaca]|uniref:Myb/SANT-like domain-containing protein n=1 Tax=Prunus armeniaca TaxID=36596 RepID=A0A6J5Y0A8_PRUAR|nr:unnamed protein product [Prunus armeniaca]